MAEMHGAAQKTVREKHAKMQSLNDLPTAVAEQTMVPENGRH